MNPTSTKQVLSQVSADSFELTELINITRDIAELNAAYLAISVSVIIFLGGIFYLFNVKPLQDKLQKQEEDIEKERKDNKHKLKKLRQSVSAFKSEALSQIATLKETTLQDLQQKNEELDTKIQKIEMNAESQIKTLKFDSNLTELMQIWERHHFWKLGSLVVSENSLRSLIEYLEKSFKYGIAFSDPALLVRNIKDVLNVISKEIADDEGLVVRKQLYDNLIKAISYEQYFTNEQREEVKSLAEQVLLSKL
jgi:F0F1-type ATP synthase membrane subunit b/b'